MPVLSDRAVADVLVVLGAIARIVSETHNAPETRVASIQRALANVGIDGSQTRAERLASLRRACGRSRHLPRRATRGALPC
jgi:hypothetical protein